MIEPISLIHYITIGITVALPSLGVAIGQALASKMVIRAINKQPAAHNELSRVFFISMALSETAAVLSTLMGVILVLGPVTNSFGVIAQLGASLAITIPAFVVGIASAAPSSQAFKAIARQPLFGKKIMNLVLISQAILQTPVVFGLVIGWIIQQQIAHVITIAEALKLCASGITLALGSIGPTIGIAYFAQQACKSAGTNRAAYNEILSFTFLSQAMIETPILFSLVVSLMLAFVSVPTTAGLFTGIVYLLAAFTVGCSTLGTGISSGRVARAACEQIGKNVQLYSTLSRASILGQTLIDTNAIYGLIIALLMIFTLT